MSENWPPGRADQDPGGDTEPDAATEARLSEVSAYLGAVPLPAMPESVEARIGAALAAEAAARRLETGPEEPAGPTGPPGPTMAPVPTGPPGPTKPTVTRPRSRRRWGGARHNRGLLVAVGTVAACLILALLAVVLPGGGSTTPGSASGAAAGSFSESHPLQGASSAGSAASASSPDSASATAGAATVPGPAATEPGFMVTESGTKYRRATLASQVSAALRAMGSTQPGSVRAGFIATAPSTALRGCVQHLTGGVQPRLVDSATYQGRAAYVIATADRAWVTEPGCTAAHPEVIVSVPLAGLSGNLRALVSVEQ